MAVREIKTRLSVDGEQAFKRAITDANTSLKNMGTQLTLAAAQFKKDGDAMKFMETRSKTLKSEISQQQQIVKALEKALEDSTKAYGANSTKTEKWEAELNRAKAKLIGLQTELNNNENGLDKSGRAFEDATDKAADFQATVSNIGKNVSFATVTGGLDKITSGLENVLKKAINVGVTIKDLFVDAGQWADELTTDATRYGLDTETLQRWQYAAKMVDTPVENIVAARDKLTKKMNSGWKDGKRDMWEILGIDLTDADGKARDKWDILWEAGQTLLNVAEMQEQGKTNLDAEALSMELFGKSWRDMLPLFKAGRKEFEAYAAAAPIVADKNVTALTGMNDSLETTETNWEALKNTFLAELAPTMTKVSDSLSGLLENLLEWIESDDGQAAIQGLAEALESLFSGLSDIKFEDALEKAKGALDALKEALVWVKNNGSNIANALKYIGIGLGAIKLTNAGLKVLQLISGFTGLLGGGGGGAGIGSTIAGGIGAGLLKAAPWLAGLAVFTQNAWTPQGNDDIWDESGNPTELGKSMGITWKQSEDIRHYSEHQSLMTGPTYKYPTNTANVGTSGIISPHGRGKFNLTQEQRDLAEAYWDVYRNGTTGNAFDQAYDALEAAFGPDGESFERLMGYMDSLLETMNENEHTSNWNLMDYVNLPVSWFKGGGVNTRQQNQINDALAQMMFESGAGPVSGRWAALMNGGDIKEFNRLPGQMQDKVQIGVQRGISGLRVTIDGQVAGRILAPYVSQEIARGAQ